MRISRLPAVHAIEIRLRRLRPLVPASLFAAWFGASGMLAAAAHARSTVLITLAAVTMLGSFAGLVGWVLISDKLTRRPPRHVPWSTRQWHDFEGSFWALVSRSGAPPNPRPGRNEA